VLSLKHLQNIVSSGRLRRLAYKRQRRREVSVAGGFKSSLSSRRRNNDWKKIN